MFFTPWLRSFSRRIRFPKRRQKRLSPQQHQKMLRGPIVVSAHAEGLEPRMVLTPPSFVSVTPNGGLFLADGTTLTETPRELLFQFSPGQTLNTNSFGAIQIYGAGHDGGFRSASTVTDFGSTGAAVLRIGTARLGVAENGTTLTVNKSDLGLNALPTIASGPGTVTLTLNSNATTPTTANGLLNFLSTDATAKTLLTGELFPGSAGSTSLAGITNGTLFTLSGANAASALSNFNAGAGFNMQFQANTVGTAGNLISLQFVRRDLGNVGATIREPLITVVGNRIEVTLNSNATAFTQASDLITAWGRPANAAANALVTPSVAFQTGATSPSLAAIPDGTVLQLSGADQLLTPGYRNLESGSSREVIYRFAESLGNDQYRIQVVGAGANPLTNGGGEVVNNGADTLLTFTLDLGAQVTSVVPQPVVRDQVLTVLNLANVSDGDVLLIDPGTLSTLGTPNLFSFEFDRDGGAGNVRAGNNRINISAAATPADVANSIAAAITPVLTAQMQGVTAVYVATNNFVTIRGNAFDPRVTISQRNAGLSLRAGGITQRQNLVNVYFNADELDGTLATDPRFYQLIDTFGTVSTADDEMRIPTSVVYDNVHHTAVLDFGLNLPTGTYKLRTGASDETNNTTLTAVDVGRVHASSPFEQLGFIGDAGGDQDFDLYRFDVQAGTNITATVQPGTSLNSALRLFDSTGTGAIAFNNSGAANGDPDQITFFTPTGGTFYLGVSNSANVGYSAVDGTGTTTGGTTGTYRLTIAGDTIIPTGDDNSSFGTATPVGPLGRGGQSFVSQIEPQAIPIPPQAGGPDEPGHREIPAESHGVGPGTALAAPGSLGVVSFHFPLTYGVDAQGNTLINQITEDQKQRAREIYEIFASLYGFEVREGGGTGIVTGDPRAVDPSIPPDAVGGIAGGGLALMNARLNFTAADNQFGGSWMGIALHEIGHTIGLLHSYELRSDQGNGTQGEDQYPGNNDIVHGRRISPNNGSDIDLYQFNVTTTGEFTAEIMSERDAALLNNGLLNSVLRLYQQNADGTKTLIAQNDDYFSIDSYLKLTLNPGTYFVGVSSTGNNDYDPVVSDTGYGGTSEGDYRLNLNFKTESSGSLLDSTAQRFDGDLDNTAGGSANEFAFRSNLDPSGTLYVDKSVITNLTSAINAVTTAIPVRDASVFGATSGFQIRIDNEVMLVNSIAGNTLNVTRAQAGTTAATHLTGKAVRRNPAVAGTGTTANPFGLISDAIAAATPGSIIRIVGNGGTDNDILTAQDNRAYLIGLNDSFATLEDGSTFVAPKDVVVQMDAGAVFKLNRAVIDAGTSAVGIDRSGGALQVLGTTKQSVYFTTHENDLLGGDSDGVTDGASAGDWGGLVMRADSDFQAPDAGANPSAPGIFLNHINHADISYGGGLVTVNSVTDTYNSIHIVTNRPTVTFNTVRNGADAAMSANPDSFDDSRGRIGPELYSNTLSNNTLNGIFVRIDTSAGTPLDRLTKTARFDDTDIVHLITENLEIVGNPGGPLNGEPRPSGRLAIDPGVVVKLGSSRIEGMRGSSHLIAEGTVGNPVILTSVNDDRYGAGGTFDSTNNGAAVGPAAGNWGGLMFNATSRLSVDNAYIAYAGGNIPIEGGFANFNTIEAHHGAKVRVANTLFENNGSGGGGSRNGRGGSSAATIFVRQAQPIIVNNVFRNNAGAVIDINANAMLSTFQRDTGSSTGDLRAFTEFAGNHGPLVRLNRMSGNGVNGMNVRGDVLTTESVWDDTDIVHVLRSEIRVDQHHTYSGLRLQSNPGESLVVKLLGANAGFTADGIILLDIDDRIGGTVQVLGQPGFPVVLTSLNDDSVGASLDPNGFPQRDTDNDGAASPAVPGQWRSILFNKNSNDRNVRTELEEERANNGGLEINDNAGNAQFLGELAPQHVTGPDLVADPTQLGITKRINSDDNRPAGFEVHGFISADDSGDVDLYSFDATAGSEIWVDLDRTRGGALDPVVELVQADGTVLVRARYNPATGQVEDLLEGAQPAGEQLTKFASDGGDFYTFNFRDTGFRTTLPGNPGTVGTYFVRVRSNQATNADLNNVVDGGLTSGEYQLQIRLRQTDEKPGSVVRFADIRYATIGIEVNGLPAHSPLLSEVVESTQNNGPNQTHQPMGNLLESDRNTINFGGTLESRNDQDFYQFNSDYAQTILGGSIQVIGGSSGGGKTWTTVFDLDYADGLSRGDTTMIVYTVDANGNSVPVLIGRESSIEDDLPAVGVGQGSDLDDLTRGSVGPLDPYIGPVQLPTGNPGSTTNYSVAVSSNAFLNSQLQQTYDSTAKNQLTRLEPVNSTTRIVEDHIGFQGYTSNGAAVDPTLVTGLFDLTDEITLNTHVRAFDLGDVPLFVSRGNSLVTVNSLFGQLVTNVSTDQGLSGSGNTVQDIVMRSDGTLFAYQRMAATNDNAGRLSTVNTGNGAVTDFNAGADDGITGETAPYVDGNNSDLDDLTITNEVGAVTFRRNGGGTFYDGYYSVFENEGGGAGTDTTRNSKLYHFDANTGVIQNTANDTGFVNIQYPSVTYATTFISVTDTSPASTIITLQARAPGSGGNGITVNVNRSLGTGSQSVTAAGRTITVNTGTAATAQGIVDAINTHGVAGLLVQAARTTNNNVTASLTASSGGLTAGGTQGAQGVLKGNVTGLAFDQFSGGNLYGVTNRGEFIQIAPTTGLATLIADFTSSGIGTIATTNGFQGLALGPQNLDLDNDNVGDYANTFFAVTQDGRLVAFDNTGTPVSAFDSNRQSQTLSIEGEQETLTADMTVQATSLLVSDASVFTSPTPFEIQVGTERMLVTNVNTVTDTLTVTRGLDATFVTNVDTLTPVAVGDLTVTVANGGLFATATPFMIRIDNELMRVTNVAGNSLVVVRAQGGTIQAAHNAGSSIYETSAAAHVTGDRVLDLSSESTLTFDTGTTLLTTAPLNINAPGAVSVDETQEVDVVAYSGTWGIDIVNNFAHTTALSQDVADLIEGNPDTIFVQSTAGFPASPFVIRIEDEFMQVTSVGANSFNVIRGVRNSIAVAHQGDAATGQTLAPQTVYEVLTTTLNEPGNLAAAAVETLMLGMDAAATTVTTVGVLPGVVDNVSRILIDGEQMLVTGGAGTNILMVTRGQNLTAAAGHGATSTVTLMNATINVLDTDGATLANTPFIRIDNEVMRVLAITATSFDVLRASNGTANAMHTDGASIDRILTATLSATSRTAAQVETAILTALTSGGVTATAADIVTNLGTTGVVPGTPLTATPVSVQFTGALGSHDWQSLRVDTSNLVGNDIDQVSLGVSFIGGNFQLQFVTTLGTLTTTPAALNYNATLAELTTELDAIVGVGNYTLANYTTVGGAGTAISSFDVQFTGLLQDQVVTTSILNAASLQNQEINTLRRTGAAPTSGTFDLRITAPAITTVNVTGADAIAFNDTGANIQTKINNAISAAGVLGAVTVTPAGGSFDAGTTYTITFTGAYDDRNVTLSSPANTLNTALAPTINTTINGNSNGTTSALQTGTAVYGNVFTTADGNLSVLDALQALPTALLNGATDLQVTGGDLPLTDVSITFLDPSFTAANQPNLLLVNNSQMRNTDGVDVGTPVLGEAESFVEITGSPGDGLADSFLIAVPGLSGTTGLAFSPLDFNLWHPTTRRGAADEPGHGINAAYDNSRTPSAESRDIDDNQGNTRTQSEAQGGHSFYFGLERHQNVTTPTYLNYENATTQLGILNNLVHSDLTTINTAITDNNTNDTGSYNLPGGAYGSLVTNPFDLVSSEGATNRDRPVLYFNYFLETEDQNIEIPNGTMRDSARAFISNDGGVTWNLLATNNVTLTGAGVAVGSDTSELPNFVTHSRLANNGDPRQDVQPLFDNTGTWRQSRIDLSDYVNQTGLLLRFDFSTAGTVITSGLSTNDDPDPVTGQSLSTDVDSFGDLTDERRGQTNNREGFYIDDLVVGWAERGEMITASAVDQTYFEVPQAPASLKLPQELLSGNYQVEIRRGFEYAGNIDKKTPDIAVSNTFDTNVRFIPGSTLGLPDVDDDFELFSLPDVVDPDLTTFGFDPAVGWIANAPSVSDSPWFVAPTSLPSISTNLNGTLNGTTLNTVINVDDASIFPAAGTPFILFVENEPMGAQVAFGNLIVVARLAAFAVPHADNSVVSFSTAAAQSSPIVDNQTSTMQVTQITAGLTFRYKVTADEGDAFRVYLDQFAGEGVPLLEVSASQFAALPKDADGFVTATLAFTPGTHTIYFSYQKDGTDGLDLILNSLENAIIDDVVFIGLGASAIRGDRNVVRDQGHFQIEGNFIRDSLQNGIDVEAGPRSAIGNLPTPGSPINFGTPQSERLAPGVTIVNNVVAGFGNVGIRFGGDADSTGNAADPASVVPFGKIINNTIYGGAAPTGTGISVHSFSAPTLLNNLIANTQTGIAVDVTSGPTIVGRTYFHNNNNTGVQGSNTIVDPLGTTNPMFINPATGNFYLADRAGAVDRSLSSLPDRPTFVSVKQQVALEQSDVFVPDQDLFGQDRVDDSTQLPSGLGGEVFFDIGAVERADFQGGISTLIVPEDGGPEDLDPNVTQVSIDNPLFFNEIRVQFTDDGIGIDDATINLTGSQFVLTQTTGAGIVVLQNNVDYIFAYNSNTNQAILTSVTTYPTEARFNLVIDNSAATGIKDFAGNPLVQNQTDGSVQFNILVTDGENDAPIVNLPITPSTNEDTAITLTGANAISISDADAFLSNGDLLISLVATNGTFSLNAAAIAVLNFTVGDGTADPSMSFTGSLDEINAALNGLSFLPDPDDNNPSGTATPVAPQDLIQLAISVDDQGEYWVNPVTGLLDPKTGSGTLLFAVQPINDEPVFAIPASITVNEDANAADVAAAGGTAFATGIAPGPATADDEVGQTLTFSTPSLVSSTGTLTFSTAPTIDLLTGNLTFIPTANTNGSATFTVFLTDDGLNTPAPNDNTSVTRTFTINVTAVNDAPTLNFGTAPTINEDAGAQTVPGFATFDDGDPEITQSWPAFPVGYSITGATSNRGFSGVGTIFSSISFNTTTGDLSYTLMPNVNGDITVTMTVTDGGEVVGPPATSSPLMFTLTANPVNDQPSVATPAFSHVPVAANAQAPGITTAGFATPTFGPATAIDEIPPADPFTQNVADYIVSAPATLYGDLAFNVNPDIANNGTLTYTTTAGAATSGIAVVTVQLQDNGGTALGGVDTSTPLDFYIVVGLPNPPVLYNVEADNITLILNGAGTTLEIRDSDNIATILESYTLATMTDGLLIRGTSVSNTITFDYTNGDPIPAGIGVILSGSLGSDAIRLVNDNLVSSVDYTFAEADRGTIQINNGSGNRLINYIQFEQPVTDSLGAASRSFSYSNVNDDVTLIDASAAGDGLSTISSVVAASATPSSLTVNFRTTAAASLTVNTDTPSGVGNDILRVTGYDSTITTTSFNGIGGNDLLIGGATGNSFSISGSNAGTLNGAGRAFSQFESLQGGAGADSFAFASAAGSISGTIDGQGGSNTLDYSSFGAGSVEVNLTTSFATNVTGGLVLNGTSLMSTVIGGSGGDVLTGNASAASSLVGNDGNDLLVGGSGNDSLSGGNNDDTLVDGSGNDNLDGGSGNDTYVLTPGSTDVLNDAGGTTDVLDFSGASAGVTINLDFVGATAAFDQTVFGSNIVRLATGTFENFIGSSSDDFVRVTSNSVVRNVNGGIGSDKLIGPDAVNSWNITGVNSGTITGFMTFSNVENLVGGSAADTFNMGIGGSVAGTINSGSGVSNDTLNYSAYLAGSNVTVNLATGSATNVFGGLAAGLVGSFETVIGGAGDDTLTGSDNPDSLFGGLGNDVLSDGLGNDSLDGASGDDRYILRPTGSDTVNDNSGSDTVDFSNSTLAIGSSFTPFDLDNVLTAQTVFSGASVRLITGAFESFIGSSQNDTVKATVIGAPRTINGNGGTDTLLAGDAAKNWHITALNGGDIGLPGSFDFSSVENLVGGTSVDSFQFSGAGQLSGTINGGTGSDVLDYSLLTTAVFVNLGTSAASLINSGLTGGFTGIESFIGSSAAGFDTLTGPNAIRQWDITSANAGTIDSIPSSALVGFSSFENLTGGTAADTFVLANGVGVSGQVNGGTGVGVTDTLSYAGYTTPVSINLTTNTATNLGNQTNFESFIGGSAGDTFTGPTQANTWNISAASTGTITNVNGTLSFASFETLGGGNSSDNFVFGAGSSIGGLNGGQGLDTLDLSNLGVVRSVTLTGTTVDGFSGADAAVTSGFTGINSIVATSLTPDSLTSIIAAPTTWNLGSTNSLVVNSQTLNFSLFDSFTGGNGGNTFNINGPVTGNLVGGSGDDVFNFNAGGSLNGSVAGNGGNDTLGFPGISNALIITLLSADATGYSGTNSLISGGFSGINTLAGGNGSDTLIGLNAPATWAIGATRSYTSGGNTLVFSSLENLNGGNNSDVYNITGTQNVNLDGGAGDDTFNVADGASITGNLIGGAHVSGDTVSYAGNTTPAIVNLNNLNTIETVIGGNGSDTLIGLTSGSTFNITGPDSGTVGGIVFQNFQNLTGSGNADTFNLTDTGVLTGAIDGGLGIDVLSFAAMTSSRVVTLTGVGAGDGFNGIEGSITGGFTNINTLTGSSAANDQLFGLDVAVNAIATWAINSTMTYSASGRTLTFSAFETMTGGTGNDEFTVTGARSGNLHGGVGSGLDTYRFMAGATLTGDIDGDAGNDTLSFEFYTSAVSVTLNENLGDGYGGSAPPIVSGGFHNIDTLIGGTATDTLNGINDTAAWEVDGTNRYSTPGSTIDEGHYLFFNLFENLNGGIESDTFIVTGNQSINLLGNDGDDTFRLTAVSSLTGTINGGNGFDTYDLSAKTTAQTVSISNLISIENVNGSLANDTLVGLNTATTFVIDGPNSGTAGTIGFTGFENLQGGTAGDSFEFLDGGSISGTINGGTGSDALRFTDMISSQQITLTGLGINDGFAGNAGATVASFTNIDSVAGSSVDVSDAVHGMNVTSTWTASGTGINYTASSRTINLSNVELLLGGTGADTFTLNATSIVTSIDAGDNADTLNASAATINMTLFGGTGNDTILNGSGGDFIDGGLGTDELRQTTDNNQTLTDSSATGMGGDTLASIERALLTGGGSGNSIDATGFSFAATLNGLGGNDTIFGGTGNDSINGGDGSDSVSGGDGVDIVDGGNGNDDSVSGGLGNDVLIGGAGANDLVVEEGLSGNVTLTVTALTSSMGSDTISGFEGASLTAGSDNNVINASTFTGSTTLDGGAGSDTITGGSGSDNILGGDDNDTLNGKAGNDSLDGGAGDDVLTGDLGNDQIDGGVDTDVLSETGNVNMTLTNVSLVGLGTDSLLNIEGAKLTGGISNNTINAAEFSIGSVTLFGDAGNDSLWGGSQGDSIDGGSGLDTLRGNDGDDTLRGGAGTDSLDGGEGNDDLNGQADNDTILGGNANDTITGELGSDSLDGGLGVDRLSETANVNFVLTASQLTGVGTDKVLNFESVVLTGGTGNNSINATGYTGSVSLFGLGGNDTLTGSSNGDLLEGGDGNDQLTGALGNDTIDGGIGTDTLVETGAITFTLTNTTLTGVGSDVLIVIEAAKLTSGSANSTINASAFTAGPVTLTGGAGNDSLLGGSGNDSINGGTAGKDTIRGGGGNDTLNGGAGGTTVGTAPSSANRDDIIHGDAGNDSILGLGGNDFLFGESGNDTIDGGDGHDVIDGGDDSDNILGGLGNDAIRGGSGNDTLNGNDGNDSILGGTGADSILGGNGNDLLRGEDGNDTLSGQTGTDSLDGGAGANTLISPLGDLTGVFSAFSDDSFNALISSIP